MPSSGSSIYVQESCLLACTPMEYGEGHVEWDIAPNPPKPYNEVGKSFVVDFINVIQSFMFKERAFIPLCRMRDMQCVKHVLNKGVLSLRWLLKMGTLVFMEVISLLQPNTRVAMSRP